MDKGDDEKYFVVRQHAIDSFFQDFLWMCQLHLLSLSQQRIQQTYLESPLLETTRVAGVPVVHLLILCKVIIFNLIRIDDNNIITTIIVLGRVDRLVLSHQQTANLGWKTTKILSNNRRKYQIHVHLHPQAAMNAWTRSLALCHNQTWYSSRWQRRKLDSKK